MSVAALYSFALQLVQQKLELEHALAALQAEVTAAREAQTQAATELQHLRGSVGSPADPRLR